VHRVKDLDGEILLRLCPPLPTPADPKREGVPCETKSGEEQRV
jgi:hypothetical protein